VAHRVVGTKLKTTPSSSRVKILTTLKSVLSVEFVLPSLVWLVENLIKTFRIWYITLTSPFNISEVIIQMLVGMYEFLNDSWCAG